MGKNLKYALPFIVVGIFVGWILFGLLDWQVTKLKIAGAEIEPPTPTILSEKQVPTSTSEMQPTDVIPATFVPPKLVAPTDTLILPTNTPILPTNTPQQIDVSQSIIWQLNPELPQPQGFSGWISTGYAENFQSSVWSRGVNVSITEDQLLLVFGGLANLPTIGEMGTRTSCFVIASRGPLNLSLDLMSARLEVHDVDRTANSLAWAAEKAKVLQEVYPSTCGKGLDVAIGKLYLPPKFRPRVKVDVKYNHHHPWRKNRGKKTQAIQQRIQIQGGTRSRQGGQNYQPTG